MLTNVFCRFAAGCRISLQLGCWILDLVRALHCGENLLRQLFCMDTMLLLSWFQVYTIYISIRERKKKKIVFVWFVHACRWEERTRKWNPLQYSWFLGCYSAFSVIKKMLAFLWFWGSYQNVSLSWKLETEYVPRAQHWITFCLHSECVCKSAIIMSIILLFLRFWFLCGFRNFFVVYCLGTPDHLIHFIVPIFKPICYLQLTFTIISLFIMVMLCFRAYSECS